MSKRIYQLFLRMQEKQASDLFLTCGKKSFYRVFNDLVHEEDEDEITDTEFIEFFNDYLPANTQDKLILERDLDIGISINEGERYRLNLYFQKGRMAMVVRRVPLGNLDLDKLTLPAETLKNFCNSARGLLLITGATGSGKSSTMAAMLNYINETTSKHIITIEDPIEFIHKEKKCVITQREVGSDTLNFENALKHVVRQSPDIIFIGEMRDMETIQTAISAAMTGHLVISTMHTVDPSQTLERIINFFPDHQRDQIALDFGMSLVGVISQRLIQMKDQAGLIPAFEILAGTALVRRMITSRHLEEIPDLIKSGTNDGMVTFTRSLVELVKDGKINIEVAAAASTNREEFLLAAQGMETGIDSLRELESLETDRKLNMKSLLKAAVKHGASDLLITVNKAPLLRIDGVLQELNLPTLKASDTQRLIFSVLNPNQRATFEMEREIDFALSVHTMDENISTELVGHRFRVNGFYQKGNVSVAFRVIPRIIPTAKEIGVPPIIMKLANRMQGLILVTGPTGHGKSTTQACLIDEINRTRSCHIITVEDPIEYVHTGQKAVIEQREVLADTLSFNNALKYVLRQDPDVILIGEMRDSETISAALTASETGHLVIATLHTNDCSQTVDRIIDSFPPHQQNQVRSQLASCLNGVIAQRLLPRMDGNGRVACFEIMLGTTAIRSLIRDNRTHQVLATIETSAKDGMVTMDHALKELYSKNIISRQVVQSIALDPTIV